MQNTPLSHLQNNRIRVATSNGIDLRTAEAECRSIARSHYENFLVASIMVPRRYRQAMYNIYAFCRTADDLADESASPRIAAKSLDEFQQQLDATFEGSPPSNIFVALADTIERYRLSKQPFDDLLAAFQQDQHKHRYETRGELMEYCQCSADPVGRMVLQLAGCVDEARQMLSDQICTGLQLANFCQDVGRDYAMDRIYLPTEDWAKHGVCESMFSRRSTPDPLRRLIAEYCDLAEEKFNSGLPLSNEVPSWLAGDVRLFARGGLATIRAIRKIDFDVLRLRPTVGKFQQLRLLGQTIAGRLQW